MARLRIEIEAEEEHLGVLLDALDLYARLRIGQLDRVQWAVGADPLSVEPFMNELRRAIWPTWPLHGGPSIGNSREVPERHRLAYDLQRVLAQRVAQRDPETLPWSVDLRDPPKVADHPLPRATITEESR